VALLLSLTEAVLEGVTPAGSDEVGEALSVLEADCVVLGVGAGVPVAVPVEVPVPLEEAVCVGVALLAAGPIAFIVWRIVAASRNIAVWDDYDSVLGFILQLDSGAGWSGFFRRLFSLDSGHRTVN
jgi:hypothetical protein